MITESMIYWITRLDYVRGVCIGILVVGGVVGIITFAASYDSSLDSFGRRLLRWISLVCVALFFVAVGGVVFVPTTQEMAMIKVIPAVSNSEFVAERLPADARQIYELGKQRLIKELKGGQK